MWWRPDDEYSSALRGDVEALLANYGAHVSGQFREQGFDDLSVWGVGSAPDEAGQWTRTLVLISYEALADYHEVSVGRYGYDELFDLAGVDSPVGALLESWRVPRTSVFDVTTRPLPAAGTVVAGDLVQEVTTGSRQATVGVPCQLRVSAEPAFVTAGHLVNGVGSQVDVAATGHGAQTWVRGEVAHWSDPAASASADYDYAVVRLTDPRDQLLSVVHGGAAGAPTAPYQPIDVAIYSAQSGPQYGQVSGALSQLGDTTRQWLTCWQIGPSGLLTLGDSGSLVLGTSGSSTGKVLGHFVGGSYWSRGPGLINLYVQDLDSCLTAGLDQLITL
jgi:hypothetical protein